MEIIIGFSRTNSKFSPVSWIIRKFEKSEFSHTYIKWHSDSLDRNLIYHAGHGMVHFVSQCRFKLNNVVIKEYSLEIDSLQHRELVKKCVDLSGINYGIMQLLGMALERLTGIKSPFRDGDRSYVCSELVGDVLKSFIPNLTCPDLELAGPSKLEEYIRQIPNVKLINETQS